MVDIYNCLLVTPDGAVSLLRTFRKLMIQTLLPFSSIAKKLRQCAVFVGNRRCLGCIVRCEPSAVMGKPQTRRGLVQVRPQHSDVNQTYSDLWDFCAMDG